jgi:hypothetical protein
MWIEKSSLYGAPTGLDVMLGRAVGVVKPIRWTAIALMTTAPRAVESTIPRQCNVDHRRDEWITDATTN